MSSKPPAPERVVEMATDLGEQALRAASGGATGRSSGRVGGRAPGVASVATEGAFGTADLARQVAGIMLHAASGVGEQLVEMAGQLESAVTDQPRNAPGLKLRAEDRAASAPVALMLPSVSPGRKTAKSFVARNERLVGIDAMTLRCDGLFGAGGRQVPGTSIKLVPAKVELPPHGTASIECRVEVPAAAMRGSYTGLIEGSEPGSQLLVSLTVV